MRFKPGKPVIRCACSFACSCRPQNTIDVPVAISPQPVIPQAPLCFRCRAPMSRIGSVYQALLDESWDAPPMMAATRATYAAMVASQ